MEKRWQYSCKWRVGMAEFSCHPANACSEKPAKTIAKPQKLQQCAGGWNDISYSLTTTDGNSERRVLSSLGLSRVVTEEDEITPGQLGTTFCLIAPVVKLGMFNGFLDR